MDQADVQHEQTTVQRALCLGTLLKRSELESIVHNLKNNTIPDGVQRYIASRQWQENQHLLLWCEEEGLLPHFSRTERNLLARPFGTWSARYVLYATWRAEALGVLLWALRYFEELPSFDSRFEMQDVLTPIDIFNSTIDFRWMAQLRPAEELHHWRDSADLWNWRSRAAELERMGIQPPQGVSFAEIVRYSAEKGYHNHWLPTPIDGDFPVFGKAYSQMNREEYQLVSRIAHERSAALDWLCELSAEWESIPVDL